MNEQNEIDPNARTHRLRTAVIAAMAPLLVAAGCSASDADKEPTPTTPTTIEAPTTTVSPEGASQQETLDFLHSQERFDLLNSMVQAAGSIILQAKEDNTVGPFDFYNATTGEWGLGAGNAGYGYLQHNPEYGGSKDQFMIAVFQKDDGSIDLTRGISEVRITPDGKDGMTIRGWDMTDDTSESVTDWETSVVPADGSPVRTSSLYQAADHSLDELKQIDLEALKTLTDVLNTLPSAS